MTMTKLGWALCLLACAFAWVVATAVDSDADTLWQRADQIFDPLPAVAANPDNPVTVAKVALGRGLYFDRRLSNAGNVSCNSCHSLARYGVDRLPLSPGDSGELGGRNSPTVLNAALHTAQFWDGRARDVEEQAGMPVLNPVEMGIPDEAFLVERLGADAELLTAFAEAFPEDPEPLNYANIGRALGAFERTLVTPSRFDDYLRGDRSALLVDEREGLQTFLDLGCASCHNGATVGARSFRKFGLNDAYWQHTGSSKVDEGRLAVTGDPEDRYVFKVASLRNVAETGPYFHDGSVATLEEAVRIMAKLQVGVDLTLDQTENVGAFLRSLTGERPALAVRF